MAKSKAVLLVFISLSLLISVQSFAEPEQILKKDSQKFQSLFLKNLTRKHRKEAQDFYRAYLSWQKGNEASCLKELKRFRKNSVFSSYKTYLEASCLQNQKKYKTALALVPVLKNRSLKIEWDLQWLRMDLLADLKRTTELKTIADDLVKKNRKNKMVHIRSAYYLGKAYLLSGQKDLAIQEFLKILIKNVGTEFDGKVFGLMRKHGIPASKTLSEALWNQRAIKLMNSGYAYKATKLYQQFAKRGRETAYQQRIAESVFRERRYTRAAELYEEILKSGSSSQLKTLKQLATAYGRTDDFKNAIRVHKMIIAKYPGSSSAGASRAKLGFLYYDSKQFKKAIPYYGKLLEKKLSRKQQDRYRNYRFWSFYFLKDYKSALTELEAREKIVLRDKTRGLYLMYWKARTLGHLKNKKAERSLYQQIANQNAQGYYGLLAKQRLRYKKLHPETMIRPDLVSFAPNVSDYEPWQWSRQAAKDPSGIRAIAFYAFGLDNWAYSEASRFAKTHSAARSKAKIAQAGMGGNFRWSYASRKLAFAGKVSGCGSRCAWQVSYPKAYQKYVDAFADHWKLDASLAYAVMRQESAFQPQALSWAYAYGLMQIIPPTGMEIAEKVGAKDFQPYELNEPVTNTYFGTYYLRYLMDTFGDDPVLAMAGYNAGPNAVSRWYKKFGKDERDEFVEMIAYSQTRDYVRKVLVNYLTYSKLYD